MSPQHNITTSQNHLSNNFIRQCYLKIGLPSSSVSSLCPTGDRFHAQQFDPGAWWVLRCFCAWTFYFG